MQEIYFQSVYNINNIDLNIYQFGREKVKPGISCGPTFRKHYVIHLILDGKGIFRQENKTFSVCAGQAFLIIPNTKVYYEADKIFPYTYAWIEFDGLKAKEYLRQAGLTRECPIFTPKSKNNAEEFIINIIDNHDNEIKVNAYFLLFLDTLISSSSSSQPINEAQKNSGELYVKHVINYISLNYWKKITVDNLAEICGINRSHLSRIFKQKTGISLQQYILQYKMDIACQLLNTTSLSITEIAQSVGYSDPFAFSKIFKKYKYIAPNEWRNRNLSKLIDNEFKIL